MPRPIPVPVRLAIRRRWQEGQSAPQIAAELHLPESTVRDLIRRLRSGDDAALAPSYRTEPRPHSLPRQAVYAATLDLRREHPKWGAEYLRIHLQRMGHEVPATRTLQRWLRQAGLAPAPRGRPPRRDHPRGAIPHEVWQIDATEHLALKQGQACWLRVIDECSGAVLKTAVFPPRLLVPRAGLTDPADVAAGVLSVGPAGVDPGRQRHALGGDRGPAHGPGVVADRAGRGDDLEPTA